MKRLFAVLLFAAAVAAAQPMETVLQGKLPARWWKQDSIAGRLNLSADQSKKLDENFQQSRVRLIELNAAVEKEEAVLEPLVAAEKPDEAKVRAQIDRIAQARAELEKANAYLLLGARMILTGDQWRRLQDFGSGVGPRPRKVKQ
jgi:protein CpxP